MQAEPKQISTADLGAMRDRLAALISEMANRNQPVETNALLQNLAQWDSLAALDFIMAVEKEFSLELNPEVVQKSRTVEDLVGSVIAKL